MISEYQKIIAESVQVKQHIITDAALMQNIHNCITTITQAFKNGNRLYLCGNGGSAADAQHLAAEFSGRFYINRAPLPAEALHVNTSYLTAVANDYSYNDIYSRMVQGFCKAGDILIGLSTSGNSQNIIAAFEQAKKQNVICIAFTGATGGKLTTLSNIVINVPSTITPRIQESHITIGHIICEFVEKNMFA
jgi:D-sedoheptulose 7-phosphate isomerase